MKVIHIKDLNFVQLPDPVCAAIGNFDGVHLGHQLLIDKCKEHGYKSAVLTFYPHPFIYLKKLPNYPLLTPIEKKIDIIFKLNIDYLIIVEFDDRIANMSKEDFIMNMKKLGIKSCVCGYDFTFGRYAEGNIRDLEKEFEFYEIKKYILDGIRVSTTYTKELLESGNIKEANRMLGRTYSIRGQVIYGSQQGRIIGFPTANVDYKNYYLPNNGVYYVKVLLEDKEYKGMCNIGHNPTFNFTNVKRLEVHIFDLDQDIYGESIEVFFIDKIRNEKKFSSLEELIKQLKEDKELCINFTEK